MIPSAAAPSTLPPALRRGYQRLACAAALLAALLGALLAAHLLQQAGADATARSRYAASSICDTAVATASVGCVEQTRATVTGRTTSGSRSTSYSLELDVPGLGARSADVVAHQLYNAVQTGDTVTVHLWNGDVTWVSTGQVASSTIRHPARAYDNDLLGALMVGPLALAFLLYAVLVARRLRVRAPLLPSGTRTFRPLPAPLSLVVLVVFAAAFGGVIAMAFAGVSPGVYAAGAVGAALLTAAALLRMRARAAAITVDRDGVTIARRGGPEHRFPWSEVNGLRVYGRGRGRSVQLEINGVPAGSVMHLRFATAANEPLLLLLANPGAATRTSAGTWYAR